jgi:hypothetical protein
VTEPVTWIKNKYSCPKDKGRYKGGTNATSKSGRKRKKVGGGPGPIEHVKVIKIGGLTYPETASNTKWITRPRETGRK